MAKLAMPAKPALPVGMRTVNSACHVMLVVRPVSPDGHRRTVTFCRRLKAPEISSAQAVEDRRPRSACSWTARVAAQVGRPSPSRSVTAVAGGLPVACQHDWYR